MKTFLGYPRSNGTFGTRNWVIVIPAQREVSMLACKIHEMVNGTQFLMIPGYWGRSKEDRKVIARTMIGVGLNPNTAGVLIVSAKKHFGYPEINNDLLMENIQTSGTPVREVILEDVGGFYNALGEGVRLARELVLEASRVHRTSCSIQHLNLSVKCGVSDATSGVAGNPVIGMVFDKLIDAGGTAFFSETTELIGGEQMIADRAVNQQVRQDILNAVHNIEEKVKSIGEDIRSINPVPSNIAAGITTLEEKSIGAIAKSGSQPIQGVLNYGECPTKAGLYFVDAWMSAVSLPLTYAAAGSQLFIFQMGGGDLPEKYPAMPAVSSPVVSPVMYVTGNKETYAKADDSMDFNSSSVMDGTLSIEETADNMLECIIDIASGTWTKSESWNYRDQLEYYLTEPCF